VQRQKWRRQAGNDGYARVLVPRDEEQPVRATKARVSPPHLGGGDGGGDVAPTFSAALVVLEAALDEANKRAETAMALADRLEGRLAGAVDQARADRERLEFELRMAIAAQQEAQHEARAAQDAAEALRKGEEARKARGRWARVRAAWRGE
jgi:hypothetical protein